MELFCPKCGETHKHIGCFLDLDLEEIEVLRTTIKVKADSSFILECVYNYNHELHKFKYEIKAFSMRDALSSLLGQGYDD